MDIDVTDSAVPRDIAQTSYTRADQDFVISVGVVGAGYWAQNMIRVISDVGESELRYVCDLSSGALEAVSSRYPTAKCTSDLDVLLNDPTLDAIYIATPPDSHAAIATRALESGKHVLVEKPLATSSTEGADLVRLARKKELTLMAGHTFLFSPPVLKVKEMIDSGALGDVFYIDSTRVNLGKYQDSGVLWDLAPHDLSIILFWLNEAPVGVSATGRSFRSSGREDVVFLNLDFPSGAIAQIHVSWLAPAKLRRTTVSGSRQMAVYDDTAGSEALKVYDQGVDIRHPETFGEFQLSYRQGDISIPHLESTEPLRAEWEHFVQCLHNGEEPRSGSKQGLWTVKVLEATDSALQSGKRQEIDVTDLNLSRDEVSR